MYGFKGKILLLTNCNNFYWQPVDLTSAKIDILMKISGGGGNTNYSASP